MVNIVTLVSLLCLVGVTVVQSLSDIEIDEQALALKQEFLDRLKELLGEEDFEDFLKNNPDQLDIFDSFIKGFPRTTDLLETTPGNDVETTTLWNAATTPKAIANTTMLTKMTPRTDEEIAPANQVSSELENLENFTTEAVVISSSYHEPYTPRNSETTPRTDGKDAGDKYSVTPRPLMNTSPTENPDAIPKSSDEDRKVFTTPSKSSTTTSVPEIILTNGIGDRGMDGETRKFTSTIPKSIVTSSQLPNTKLNIDDDSNGSMDRHSLMNNSSTVRHETAPNEDEERRQFGLKTKILKPIITNTYTTTTSPNSFVNITQLPEITKKSQHNGSASGTTSSSMNNFTTDIQETKPAVDNKATNLPKPFVTTTRLPESTLQNNDSDSDSAATHLPIDNTSTVRQKTTPHEDEKARKFVIKLTTSEPIVFSNHTTPKPFITTTQMPDNTPRSHTSGSESGATFLPMINSTTGKPETTPNEGEESRKLGFITTTRETIIPNSHTTRMLKPFVSTTVLPQTTPRSDNNGSEYGEAGTTPNENKEASKSGFTIMRPKPIITTTHPTTITTSKPFVTSTETSETMPKVDDSLFKTTTPKPIVTITHGSTIMTPKPFVTRTQLTEVTIRSDDRATLSQTNNSSTSRPKNTTNEDEKARKFGLKTTATKPIATTTDTITTTTAKPFKTIIQLLETTVISDCSGSDSGTTSFSINNTTTGRPETTPIENEERRKISFKTSSPKSIVTSSYTTTTIPKPFERRTQLSAAHSKLDDTGRDSGATFSSMDNFTTVRPQTATKGDGQARRTMFKTTTPKPIVTITHTTFTPPNPLVPPHQLPKTKQKNYSGGSDSEATSSRMHNTTTRSPETTTSENEKPRKVGLKAATPKFTVTITHTTTTSKPFVATTQVLDTTPKIHDSGSNSRATSRTGTTPTGYEHAKKIGLKSTTPRTIVIKTQLPQTTLTSSRYSGTTSSPMKKYTIVKSYQEDDKQTENFGFQTRTRKPIVTSSLPETRKKPDKQDANVWSCDTTVERPKTIPKNEGLMRNFSVISTTAMPFLTTAQVPETVLKKHAKNKGARNNETTRFPTNEASNREPDFTPLEQQTVAPPSPNEEGITRTRFDVLFPPYKPRDITVDGEPEAPVKPDNSNGKSWRVPTYFYPISNNTFIVISNFTNSHIHVYENMMPSVMGRSMRLVASPMGFINGSSPRNEL